MCAFNNRNGGHIVLGVNDNRQIIGINSDVSSKLIKDFVTSINNANKIYPPLYLVPDLIKINEKDIIYIYVPKGTQVCRHNGKIYDRSFEGDIDITNNSELVFKLYARMQTSYFVNKVYPNWLLDMLDIDLIQLARKRATIRSQNHIWQDMNDEELLRSSNLILVDPESKREGITLAAILLFGKDSLIMSVLPQHKTDAIFRIQNLDRYDDREVVTTNLIDSYDRLIKFGQKHLNDLFVLDGVQKINARDGILREIGFADELGSGMRNTYKYAKLYSYDTPKFVEGDVFRTIIPIREIAMSKVGKSDALDFSKTPQAREKTPQAAKNILQLKHKIEMLKLSNIDIMVLEQIIDNPQITLKLIAQNSKIEYEKIKWSVRKMAG